MTKSKSSSNNASTDKKKAKKSSSSSSSSSDDAAAVKAKYPTAKTALSAAKERWKKMKTKEEKVLLYSFFEKGSVECARALIGKKLCIGGKSAYIIEAEAYRADEEAAAHGYGARATKGKGTRAELVWKSPARFYLYNIHTHSCLDFVVEPDGVSGCVLIRAVRCCETHEAVFGPGKLCKWFGIDVKSHNDTKMMQGGVPEEVALSKTDKDKRCFVAEGVVDPGEIIVGPRVGISKAKDLQWRFSVLN